MWRASASSYVLAHDIVNSVWLNERNRDRSPKFLEEKGMACVCMDEPQGFASSAPPVAQVTADVAYVRVHGRNSEAVQHEPG